MNVAFKFPVFALALTLLASPLEAQAPAPGGPGGPPAGPGRGGGPGGGGGRGGGTPAPDPFTDPIAATEGVIRVSFAEFARLPEIDGVHARVMLLIDEPGTDRLFANDMRGPLYRLSYDGSEVVEYLNINAADWGIGVQSGGRERGFQSFAFHPQFGEAGTPGYGKFYTYTDTNNLTPTADFLPGGGSATHHSVLHEWTATNPNAPTYAGSQPREILRFEQPYANHNAGHLAFRPEARPGDPDFGLLYMGVADGGSGGDPLDLAQNPLNGFGKVFRIDPLGRDARNGKYGIPASNPFAGRTDILPEIYALGVRNPQRFGWDPTNGNMFLADIGQNIVEELSLVTPGANLGWKAWEGSFRFIASNQIELTGTRADPAMTYPVAEYGQADPLLQNSSAITGVHVYRSTEIPQLANRVLFGDFPSGEIFYISADNLPSGGQDPIRRVLLDDGGTAKTFLQVIQETNTAQGRNPANRVDLRFGSGTDGKVYLLNKSDGVIRVLVP